MTNSRTVQPRKKSMSSLVKTYQYYIAAIIGLSIILLLTRCNVNKTTGPAPLPASVVHFSKDTLLWNVPFSDTIHAKSLSASAQDGKGITVHFVDSERGMGAKDSVFSWTPGDTGRAYVNATIRGANGRCDTLRDTLFVVYAPNLSRAYRLSRDTVAQYALFTDTLRPDSGSIARFGKTDYSFHCIDSVKNMTLQDSIVSWLPQDTGLIRLRIAQCCAGGRCDTLNVALYATKSSNSKRQFHFKRDTITRFLSFTDTLRPDSGSIARFGTSVFSWHCIDSIQGMVLRDSIFQWSPQVTGLAEVTIAQCGPNGRCDTLRGSLYVVNGVFPSIPFKFSVDSLCLNVAYTDTLHASRLPVSKSIGRIVSFHLIGGEKGIELNDSVFFWIPRDSGRSSVSIVVGDSAGRFYSIQDTFIVYQCSLEHLYCPSYTHKNDAISGRQSDLPPGFFVYSYEYDPANQVKGLYISDIRNFSPSIIPNTENEVPRSIKISDDGKWILYVNGYDAYVISIDGSKKYKAPLSGAQVLMVDLYRNGPNGTEICYTTTDTVRQEIYAIQVSLDSVASFGAIRTLADLTGSFRLEPYYPISVVKDQILSAFSLLWQGAYVLRMGFLTIPDGGRGLALPQHMYKWANEVGKQVWGCNSTMSHDGSQCVYIPGNAGMGGLGGGMGTCIPPEHRGFVVTPFRRVTDTAITMDDHIDKYGLSINWCPPQYNFGTWDQMDFRSWYFGNNNSLVIGCQSGTLAPVKGIWMVDWKSNVWTRLNPPDSIIPADWPAVYFTGTDTGNAIDPQYRVIRPNGGEQFSVGQACTVTVTSRRDANAGIRLKLEKGKYSLLLPGMTTSINPRVDSTFIFTIPDSFTIVQGGGQIVKVSSVSDSCSICVLDYTPSTGFHDCSDNFFSIKPAH